MGLPSNLEKCWIWCHKNRMVNVNKSLSPQRASDPLCRVGRIIKACTGLLSVISAVFIISSRSTFVPHEDGISTETKRTVKVGAIDYDLCDKNPYMNAVEESFEEIIGRSEKWLDQRSSLIEKASGPEYKKHDHKRFFPFDPMAKCKNITCVGGPCSSDDSKMVCGINELPDNDCVVYSIGGNNEWNFENGILRQTNCHVHTFDCTGPRTRFKVPRNKRLHFHHVCLGTSPKDAPKECVNGMCGATWTLEQMQEKLGHKQIDLLKIDIEGFEWLLLDHPTTNAKLPMQMLMEVHYLSGFDEVKKHGISNPSDLIRFQSHLLKMGFVVVRRDDNPFCLHCTELTLLRVTC